MELKINSIVTEFGVGEDRINNVEIRLICRLPKNEKIPVSFANGCIVSLWVSLDRVQYNTLTLRLELSLLHSQKTHSAHRRHHKFLVLAHMRLWTRGSTPSNPFNNNRRFLTVS